MTFGVALGSAVGQRINSCAPGLALEGNTYYTLPLQLQQSPPITRCCTWLLALVSTRAGGPSFLAMDPFLPMSSAGSWGGASQQVGVRIGCCVRACVPVWAMSASRPVRECDPGEMIIIMSIHPSFLPSFLPSTIRMVARWSRAATV
jgi:hypothetical protein